MEVDLGNAKALFFSADGNIYPDSLICSGVIPADLNGTPCPYSHNGHIPKPIPLNPAESTYSIDKGNPNDLCPPCAKQQLSSLGHWQGHGGLTFPEHLLPLRLFKCRQWFWLVILGLQDSEPTILHKGK